MSHYCHAKGCGIPTKPQFLMCPKHWSMVPWSLKKRVWEAYNPGQEQKKNPTQRYLIVADLAINAVAYKEGLISTGAWDRRNKQLEQKLEDLNNERPRKPKPKRKPRKW